MVFSSVAIKVPICFGNFLNGELETDSNGGVNLSIISLQNIARFFIFLHHGPR